MDYLYVLFVCTIYIYRLYVLGLCPSCSTSCKYYIVVCTGSIYQILCTSCVSLLYLLVVYTIFVKVHLSTFRASRDAVFSNSSVCQTFRPWVSSSGTGGGLQGVFIYRHFFPPFSITSSVMSSVTSFPEEGEVEGVFIKKGFQPLFSTNP